MQRKGGAMKRLARFVITALCATALLVQPAAALASSASPDPMPTLLASGFNPVPFRAGDPGATTAAPRRR